MIDTIRLLNADERKTLIEGDKRLRELIQTVRTDAELTGTVGDLALIQTVIDSHFIKPRQTYELESLGYGLGRVLESLTGMKWAMVVNEIGQNIALVDAKSGFVLYPMRMILKRIQAGKQVDVYRLARSCLTEWKRMRLIERF
jgi:hypothetical protein